ncbi:MAG: protein jag [Dehalococcoidia bacterium]|nr:protein jag [Dehalococcoidia bacterium]
MESLEMEAKTVEEAIEFALKELDVDRDAVEIEVVSKGRSGILGFGAEPARVRVSLRPESPKLSTVAKEVADRLIARMNLNLTCYPRSVPSGTDEAPILDLEGDDSGLLIGRRGETLRAFQFLLNHILSHQMGERVLVTVDVERYRERHQEKLEARALGLAERVAATGRSITMEPMPASDRRIVHMALAGHPRVTTESIGEGEERQLTILPKRG